MKLIQIFQIIVILNAAKCIVIDPICQTCLSIESSLVTQTERTQLSANLTQFSLPGFSLSTIIVDFRHLKQFPQQNNKTAFHLIFEITDVRSAQTSKIFVEDTIIGTNEYQLQSTAQLSLVVYFFVNQNFKAFEYLLRDSVSLNLSYSNNRIPGEDSSYVFVVTSQDNINLPVNKPDLTNMKSFHLENQRNDNSFESNVTYSESTMYWTTESQFVVPYFPYFSNCEGEGDIMYIMQMLQNKSDCNLVPIDQTVWISEFSFGSSATADKCSIKRKCMLEGNVQATEYPDWLTLPTGLTLFSITQQKIQWKNYAYDMNFEAQQLVLCKINSSQGSNNTNNYPLKVKMSMGYYQESQTEKRIISCLVQYDLYVASTANFTYQLEIASYPLNHTYIMLNFGFKWYVYMIVFVIIGVVGNLENLLLWIYHYFVAEERRDIKLMMYFRIIYEILKGTIMALLLQILIIIIVCLIMNGKIFTSTFYDKTTEESSSPRVLFDYILDNPTKNYDSNEIQTLRSGRMGIAFITIGILIILKKCRYFIGKEKTTQQYKNFSILGRMFKPLSWNIGKFLFGTFFYIILMYFFIYFAYSTVYSSNIWTFIVVMKVLQVIMEEITNSAYGDILPALPLKIITDITAYLNTISAADLYDFLFGSLIDVAITMIQKIYIFQIQNIIVDKIVQKSEELNKFYMNLMNQEDGDEEGMQNFGSEEQMLNNEEDGDNQQVFIRREVQQVEFFQEQIKQVYVWTRVEQQQRVIFECKETEQERKLKKKYFQSLQKEYKYQRQLLFRDSNKQLGIEEEEREKFNYRTNNENNNQNENIEGELAEAMREEAIQKESAIFQLLLDHMAMIYTSLVNPFAVFIFWLTYDESAILKKYGIVYNTVVLYILSALVIGFFSVINIIMIFHILESYMGLSFEQQINDILSRFNVRRSFWKAQEQELNQNLKPQIRGADHYCLSSQLFFILTVYIGGMILVILGLAIVFQANYNFFDDIATVPIIFFWTIFLFIFIEIVKKVAIFFNVWDYKKYQAGNEEKNFENTQNGGNPYAVMDQKQLLRQLQENSDFKTQNIIFAPLEELPRFKKLFQSIEKTSIKDEKQLMNEDQQNQRDQSQDKPISKKHKWMLQQQNLRLNNHEERQQILLAQKRLETICKKLQPLFAKQAFKIQYSQKNRQYIKENIEKILPLVEYLPELQQFKNLLLPGSSTNGGHPTSGSADSSKPNDQKRQQSATVMNKNMDPVIAQILLEWLRATQKANSRRITNGLEEESKLKKCSFCYETWGLYYGHGGMCLECSMRMANQKKQSGQFSKENQVFARSKSKQKESQRMGRKRKTTKKKNGLNVITEEEDYDDENDSEYDDQNGNNSEDQIIKGSSRKEHRD